MAAKRPGRELSLWAASLSVAMALASPVTAWAGTDNAVTRPVATRPAGEAEPAGPLPVPTVVPPRPPALPGDLSNLSIEDLMNVEVRSVAKQKQRVADAPAAVSVISQDDVRRSGLTSIPELLRTVPGMSVARLNANVWQISARGFADQFANKLLVLQDGRTLYNQGFGGVYWDMPDYLLPDLERIEVIRGPGATLWGANAVNGVINITSKPAAETQGLLVTGTASNVETIGGVRYGGRIDDLTFYRVYGKYRQTDDFLTAAGDHAADGWEMPQGGFRIDRQATPSDLLTLQGDVRREVGGNYVRLPTLAPPFTQSVAPTFAAGGGNVLGRWTHTVSPDSDFSVQAYFDRLYRHEVVGTYEQNTLDLDFQHRFKLGDRNEVIYGLGYRYTAFQVGETAYLETTPGRRDDYEASGFVQDDLAVVPDRFHVILGTKVSNTSYAGWAVQPSGRLLWTPDEHHSVWTSVSRAVRTPTAFEQYGRVWYQTVPTAAGVPGTIEIMGDPNAGLESMTAYEVGYRVQPHRDVSVDVAGFVNVYDDLRTYDPRAPRLVTAPTPHLVIATDANGNMYGESYGVEVAGQWRATDRLHLSASYSLVATSLHVRDGGDPSNVGSGEDGTPRNQAQVHARYGLTDRLELNAAAYYRERTTNNGDTPSYVRADLGLTYRPADHLELTVGVQNLLDDRHPEAASNIYGLATEVPRTVFAGFTARF